MRTVKIVALTSIVTFVVTVCGLQIYNKVKAETIIGEGGCPISAILEAQENGSVYNVFSPIGESTIKQIQQAPRLSTLNGKTIAVVGGSFMETNC